MNSKEKILEFLRQNAEKEYTAKELVAQIGFTVDTIRKNAQKLGQENQIYCGLVKDVQKDLIFKVYRFRSISGKTGIKTRSDLFEEIKKQKSINQIVKLIGGDIERFCGLEHGHFEALQNLYNAIYEHLQSQFDFFGIRIQLPQRIQDEKQTKSNIKKPSHRTTNREVPSNNVEQLNLFSQNTEMTNNGVQQKVEPIQVVLSTNTLHNSTQQLDFILQIAELLEIDIEHISGLSNGDLSSLTNLQSSIQNFHLNQNIKYKTEIARHNEQVKDSGKYVFIDAIQSAYHSSRGDFTGVEMRVIREDDPKSFIVEQWVYYSKQNDHFYDLLYDNVDVYDLGPMGVCNELDSNGFTCSAYATLAKFNTYETYPFRFGDRGARLSQLIEDDFGLVVKALDQEFPLFLISSGSRCFFQYILSSIMDTCQYKNDPEQIDILVDKLLELDHNEEFFETVDNIMKTYYNHLLR